MRMLAVTTLSSFAVLGLSSQFAAQPSAVEPPGEKRKTVEVVIDVPRVLTLAPAGGAPFKLKDPMVLDGKLPKPEDVRCALEKALKYILDAQNQDGSWANSKDHLVPGLPRADLTFQGTASAAMSRVVMTSLCCTALRSHEDLAPERIRAAVDKGLRYVIENAPKHGEVTFGAWTWSFSTIFLTAEYRRTKDRDLKANILEAVKENAKRLVDHQGPGRLAAATLPKRPPRNGEPQPAGQGPKGTIRAGRFGLDLVEKQAAGEAGVRVYHVIPGTPASIGLVSGDRILEMDGSKTEKAEELTDLLSRVKLGQTVRFQVSRAPEAKVREKPKREKDGGWDYVAPLAAGGTQSFTTAMALIALLEAKASGVDVAADVIDRGVNTLLAMRHREEGSWEDSFYYTVSDLNRPPPDVRASVGRTTICTLALLRAGKADQEDLACAVESFALRRGELDRVLGFGGTHYLKDFGKASYYYLFAHYANAAALHSLEDKTVQKHCGMAIVEALLRIQTDEGTWTDHPAFGRLYGTAMSLWALDAAKLVIPEAYKEPLPSLK